MYTLYAKQQGNKMKTFTVSREEFENTIRDAKHKPEVTIEIINDNMLKETSHGYSFIVQTMQNRRLNLEQLTIFDFMEV